MTDIRLLDDKYDKAWTELIFIACDLDYESWKEDILTKEILNLHLDEIVEQIFNSMAENVENDSINYSGDFSYVDSVLVGFQIEGLFGLGDPLAKRKFKDEVIKRLILDYTPTILYLLKGGYLSMFTAEEFEFLLSEISGKIYSLDKRVLDMLFISDDFDEIPPIDRFSIRAIIFSIDHPSINLLELIVRFGNLYYRRSSSWIIKFLDRIVRKKPEFFREKIDLFLKKGYINLPIKKKSLENVDQLDFSEMDNFSIILYNRYFRDMNFKYT